MCNDLPYTIIKQFLKSKVLYSIKRKNTTEKDQILSLTTTRVSYLTLHKGRDKTLLKHFLIVNERNLRTILNGHFI